MFLTALEQSWQFLILNEAGGNKVLADKQYR